MNNLPKVSVGIPAYNEELNIKKLLTSLLKQKGENFELFEIIVVSDGSTDNTVKEVESLNNSLVKVIGDAGRKGVAARQNELLKFFKGDILVILNADVLPETDSVISSLIKPIVSDPEKVGLVSGKIMPVKPVTLFESIIAYSVIFKHELVSSINGGDTVYTCFGPIRAFSKKFAEKFEWPVVVSEDAYSYFACISKGFIFKSVPEAVVKYRVPQNLTDHVKQSSRFTGGQDDLAKHIDKDLVEAEHAIPLKSMLKYSIKYFFKNPILFSGYIFVMILTKFLGTKKNGASIKWDQVKSSKELG